MLMRLFPVLVLLVLSTNVYAEVNLLTYGADPTGGADSGPALQAAIDALGGPNGTTLYVPPGTYRIATGVTRNFLNGASSIVIRGEGSASILKIAVGSGGRALQLQNLQSVLMDNLTFASSTTNGTAVDALYTLSFEYCRIAVIRRCDFYGVTTVRGGAAGMPEGAVVYSYHSDLRIEQSAFRGCAGDYTIGTTPFDGTPVVDNENWTGLSVTDTEFVDWGILNGVGYIGATSPPSAAWIRLRRPAPRTDANGNAGQAAAAQAHVVLRRVRMDEGAYYGIAMRPPENDPTAESISHVTLSGLMINGFNDSGTGIGSGIYVHGADRVLIERSWMGWTTQAVKAAIELVDVRSAVIDSVICDLSKSMTKFKVAGATNLTIRNSVYSALEGTPAVLNVETNDRMATAVPVRVVSTSTSATANDQILVSTQPGTIKLPPSAGLSGRRFTVKNASAGVVVVRASDGTVDGAASKSLVTPNSSITVISAQSNWYIVSQIGTVQ